MPTLVNVSCINCNNSFNLSLKRFNESNKQKWNFFCSNKCQGKFKSKSQLLQCSNPKCKNKFIRKTSELGNKGNFCSSRCSAIVNNSCRNRKPREVILKVGKEKQATVNISVRKGKPCGNIDCLNLIPFNRVYCSKQCFGITHRIDKHTATYKNTVILKIKEFYATNRRIPYKNEAKMNKLARQAFGSWNNAIIASGFIPNPVKFAKKYIAKDGHKCDSLAEKIIDDWLYEHSVPHQIHTIYPNQKKFKTDFIIGTTWVEFFGIYGENKKYTELANKKLKLAQKLNLDFIALYPKDISKFDEILGKFKPITNKFILHDAVTFTSSYYLKEMQARSLLITD